MVDHYSRWGSRAAAGLQVVFLERETPLAIGLEALPAGGAARRLRVDDLDDATRQFQPGGQLWRQIDEDIHRFGGAAAAIEDHRDSAQLRRFGRDLVGNEALLIAARPQHQVELSQFVRITVLDEYGVAGFPGLLGDP